MADLSATSRQHYDPATYRMHTQGGVTTNIFSSNIPHRAPLLCYIAGIECPITDATVSYGVWKIPEASITMFPDPQLQRFGAEDRVPVALFYLDEYIDPEKPTWRLLFEGEITGWNYMNAAGGRALSFSCVMNIALWTQLFIFYMTSLNSVANAVVATGQDPASIAQAQAVPGFSLLRAGLLNKQQKVGEGSAEDYIKRPFDLAYNVVRSLISNRVPVKQRCVPGVNFFARWCRREQFHNRWVALPFLEEPTTEVVGKEIIDKGVPGIFPILRASQSLAAVQAIEKNVIDRYSGGSIYTILKQVLDDVFMELTMLPTAPCVGARTDGVINGEPTWRTASQQANLQVQANLLDARRILTQAQQTAVSETPALLAAFKTAGMSYVPFGEGITSQIIEDAISRLDQKTAMSLDTGPKDASLPVRLANYFIKPQMLFGLPPNCNVIFPSMVPQLSYQENYVTQPTRLYLQDASMMQFSGFATMAPDVKQTTLAALSRAYPPDADAKWQAHMRQGGGADSGRNLLVWPEEFFKGPVTARYPAPPWLLFIAAQTVANGGTVGEVVATPTNKSTKADSTTMNDHDGGAITDQNVYALYAQYEYYRHRFAQRNGAVTCAFHPYLVPGFPMAVFDDFQSQMHMIGYLMNVTQQFSHHNVVTSCNFGYGRTLYEFLDLLGNELVTGGAAGSRKNLAMAAAPAEPVKEIRDIMQHFHKAEQFYQALLHQRKAVPAVFEYRKLIAFVDGKGELEDIQIEGVNEEALAERQAAAIAAKKVLEPLLNSPKGLRHRFVDGSLDAAQTEEIRKALDVANQGVMMDPGAYEQIVGSLRLEDYISRLNVQSTETPHIRHNLTNVLQRQIMPKPGAAPFFDSYDAAMKYCARPICTLEEYIGFIRGVREGIHDNLGYGSARYYTRIRKMKGAAATFKPTDAQRGLAETPTAIDSKKDANFPELRAEWDKVLLAYRSKIYSTTEVSR